MSWHLNSAEKKELLAIARRALTNFVKEKKVCRPQTDKACLKEKRGVFVTLRKEGELRGCLGTMAGKKPLFSEVNDMAVAAASQDLRFSPVLEPELSRIKIEISVLSPVKKINDPEKIILGKHGVLVKSGLQSGVFLPQVAAEAGWNRDQLLDNLCRHKAGLPQDIWRKENCDIFVFATETFAE